MALYTCRTVEVSVISPCDKGVYESGGEFLRTLDHGN